MGLDTSVDVAAFVAVGIECVGAGATMIGGYCGLGPRFINALRDALEARGVNLETS